MVLILILMKEPTVAFKRIAYPKTAQIVEEYGYYQKGKHQFIHGYFRLYYPDGVKKIDGMYRSGKMKAFELGAIEVAR